MIKLVFTKSNAPLSKLIRWGLKEPVSHAAIVFDDKIVFHSNLLGVDLISYQNFIKKVDVLFELKFNLSLEEEEEIYQNISIRDGNSYDFKAFSYFIKCGLQYRIYNKPLPIYNPWNSKEKFLCGELLEFLPDYLFPNSKKPDFSITSPYKLFLLLKNEV